MDNSNPINYKTLSCISIKMNSKWNKLTNLLKPNKCYKNNKSKNKEIILLHKDNQYSNNSQFKQMCKSNLKE